MNLRKINVHEIGDFIFFPNRAVDSKNALIKGISVRTLIPSPRPFPFEIFYELHPSTGGCLSRPGTFIGHIFIRSKKKSDPPTSPTYNLAARIESEGRGEEEQGPANVFYL